MRENIADVNYREVMEYSLEPLIIHSELKILYINEAAEKFFRANREEVIGKSPLDIFKDASKPAITKRISGAYSKPAEVIEETVYRMDGTSVDVELYCHPIKIGDKKAIQTYVRDITEKKHLEKEMNKKMNELASTIVPILEGIAVLPLTGPLDQERTSDLLELVPVNVQKQKVGKLIIDCSGVYGIDTLVVGSLFKLTNILNLLGVQSFITGLRPELALDAVKLGINLDGIITFSNIKDVLLFLGVEYTIKVQA